MSTYLFFWEIPRNKVVGAVIRMATGHLFLKFNKNISFYKLLGTGKGETFTPNDANPLRWGILLVTDRDPFDLRVVKSWRKISTHERFFKLRAIASHGSWANKKPFQIENNLRASNKIAVITRAKIKFKLSKKFWSYVPPVVVSLKNSPGLLWAIGIGEAPIGLQGTFSLWENSSAVEEFAFKNLAHAGVIKKTRELNWYSEELFARFEVISEAE